MLPSSISSMTKSMIQHCFHPSILCSQPVHCYSQYSAFTLAHLALKLIIKYTGSTLIPNTHACTPSIEIYHQTYTEASTEAQMHSLHTDTTQVSHMHIANFLHQLNYLIIAHQLDKKPHIPIRFPHSPSRTCHPS